MLFDEIEVKCKVINFICFRIDAAKPFLINKHRNTHSFVAVETMADMENINQLV